MRRKLPLRAAANQASRLAKEAAQRARALAEEKNAARMEELDELVDRGRSAVSDATKKLTEKRADLVSKAGATTAGAAMGRGVRAVTGRIGELPLLSFPQDILKEKSNVVALTKRVEHDLSDPFTSLWLGEALLVMQRDARVYTAMKTVIAPTSLLTGEAVRTASSLGSTSTLSPADKMLRNAYNVAIVRLKQAPRDADALHVVARVYLAKKMATVGVKPAKLAVLDQTHPHFGMAMFTLSRLYLESGHH